MTEPLTPERRAEIREKTVYILERYKEDPRNFFNCHDILALLDALEAAEARIAELEAEILKLKRAETLTELAAEGQRLERETEAKGEEGA